MDLRLRQVSGLCCLSAIVYYCGGFGVGRWIDPYDALMFHQAYLRAAGG